MVSSKSKFILNLNRYRNTHRMTLNKAKVTYKEAMWYQLQGVKLKPPVRIIYTYYPPDKRITDIGNVLPIHAKFFEDVLVEVGGLPDDSYKYIRETIYKIGSIDKLDPRVEIEIEEYK